MSVLTEGKRFVEPASLSQISGLRRFGSNRARLALLLLKGRLILSSWRFSHYRAAAYPFLWNSDLFATLKGPWPFVILDLFYSLLSWLSSLLSRVGSFGPP